MDVLTIAECAQATGWSARMLRYVEDAGLVTPTRSPSGYRLYAPRQVRRLIRLRALVETHGVGLAELAFAARLRAEPELGAAVADWFAESTPDTPAEPAPGTDWLRFEQHKHERLLTHPTIRETA